MKIKLIDFGLKKDHYPFRPHENDAGADVYMPYDYTLKPGEIVRIPLGFGLMIPDGFAGYVFPRSSMAAKGLVCELPPIDSGYRGEWFVPMTNHNNKRLVIAKESVAQNFEDSIVYPYEKAIAQCMMVEVPKMAIEEISYEDLLKIESERGTGALGSSGK